MGHGIMVIATMFLGHVQYKNFKYIFFNLGIFLSRLGEPLLKYTRGIFIQPFCHFIGRQYFFSEGFSGIYS